MSTVSAIDNLVKEYLQKKGYMAAVEALEGEINNPSKFVSMNSSETKPKSSDRFQEMLVLELSGRDASIYGSSYEKFRHWVFSSTDKIREDLVPICFIIFTHSYVSLIRYGECDEDTKSQSSLFYRKWSSDFTEQFREEMSSLVSLINRAQLESHEFLYSNLFVRCVLTRKFRVSFIIADCIKQNIL